MYVGAKKNKKLSISQTEKTNKAIQYALRKIEESEVAPYVTRILLYGSCARGEQTPQSDVDLFLELSSEFPKEKLRKQIILLKSDIMPLDAWMPEIDLKITVGNNWEASKDIYYKNVRRDGLVIWEK